MEDDDEDEIVAEIDVYSCRKVLGDEAKVIAMQNDQCIEEPGPSFYWQPGI